MYLPARIQNQLIAAFVAATMTVMGMAPLPARANDADDYISKTHKIARERAQSLMNEILVEAMTSAVNSQLKADPEGVRKAFSDTQKRLQSHLQQLEPIIAVSPDEAKSMTGDELTQLSKFYRQTLIKIRSNERSLNDIAADIYNQNAVIRKIAEQFIKNLEQYCANGLAIDPYNEILPAVRPLMPTYSINFTYTIGGQDDGHGAGGRTATVGHGAEAAAIWTTIYAVNTAIAASIISGKVILTQAAMASLTTAQTATAALAAAGVTLVIAVIVIAVMSEMARKESERMVKDQRRMFVERAGIEDGRNYFKEQCRSTRALFGDLSAELNKLASGDENSIRSLKEAEPNAKKAVQEYFDILKAYHAKRTEITKTLNANSSDEDKMKAAKALEESSEGQHFKKMGEELSPEKLVPLIKHALLANFLAASQNSAAVDFGPEVDWATLDARNKALLELAIVKNSAEAEMASLPNWQAELKANIEIRSLYARLDRLIIRKAEWIFSVSRDLNKVQYEIIHREMKEWYASLRATLAIYPNSNLLKQLERDFHRIESVGVNL